MKRAVTLVREVVISVLLT